MKEDNRGITLVEIIIVVAILAVLALAAATSFGLIYSSNAKQASNEFYSLLNTCRVNTLNGANSAYIELEKVEDGYLATLYERPDADADDFSVYKELEISNVVVSYTTLVADTSGEGTTSEKSELDTDSIVLAFDRETGEFTIPTDIASGTIIVSGVSEYQLITFTSGSTEYSVKVNWQTGYSEVIK